MDKKFIITVDTEGDNLWHYKNGQVVKTENSLFIPRFQELCEKYDFKPVWLTNYEMVSDQRYVDYIKPKMEKGLCEVGIHVHAWNNPPLYELNDVYGGNPYLIEYPLDVMRAKFKTTYDLIKDKFGVAPVSHRAGRWAMNEEYFKILEEFNVKVDCSYTPGINWSMAPGATIAKGSDYRNSRRNDSIINNVVEVPATVKQTRKIAQKNMLLKSMVKTILYGRDLWLRPACTSLSDMICLSDSCIKDSKVDYLMFMMHSSEMMPGGSPYFKDESSIERMYHDVERLFQYLSNKDIKGITLDEYYKLKY